MTRGMPSLAALLGLVAVAGYQNRDKIGEFLNGLKSSNAGGTSGGILDSVKKALGDSPAGSTISGGLGELLDKFTGAGQGDTAKSWVGTGPNREISEPQLEQTLGADLIDRLMEQTGLSRDELLKRLSQTLPEAVDKLTPDGRLPSAAG